LQSYIQDDDTLRTHQMFYVTVATAEWNAVVWLTYNQTNTHEVTWALHTSVPSITYLECTTLNLQLGTVDRQTTFDEFSNISVRTQITLEKH